MNIVPRSALDSQTLLAEPANTTNNPFANRKRKREEERRAFVCHTCGHAGHVAADCTAKSHHHKKHPGGGSGECWFCLSNPKVEKHLIVSIGENCYVTLAKGPIRSEFGSHLLIMPIAHLHTADATVRTEMDKYRDAITKMFSEQKWKTIGWECTFRSLHLCYQVFFAFSSALTAINATKRL